MILQNISRVALGTPPSGCTPVRFMFKICIEEVQYFSILVWVCHTKPIWRRTHRGCSAVLELGTPESHNLFQDHADNTTSERDWARRRYRTLTNDGAESTPCRYHDIILEYAHTLDAPSWLTFSAVLETRPSSLFKNENSENEIKLRTTYQDGSCSSLSKARIFTLSLMFILLITWFIFIRVACNHVFCSSGVIILELENIPFVVLCSFAFFALDSSTLSLSMMLASFSFSARHLFVAR